MIRFACGVALAGLVLAGQAPVKRPPLIEWQATNGPFGGGRLSLLVHRNELLVPEAYGLWRSPDGGRSWRPLLGRFAAAWGHVQSGPDLFVRDLKGMHRTATLGASWVTCGAVPLTSRGDARMVPAGQRLFYWAPTAGLFRSDDRCASWIPVPAPWGVDPSLLQFVVSGPPGRIFAMTLRAAFRTTDYGATWDKIGNPPTQTFTYVPDSGSRVLIGTGDGVYRSTDDGLTWTRLGFERRWVRSLALAKDGAIYAAVENGSGRTTMMRSADDGRTWTNADDGLSGHLITGLARDDSGILYTVSDTGVYRLSSAGRWQHVGLPNFVGTSILRAPWGDIYATAGSLGVYRTADNGANWRPLLLPKDHAGPMAFTKDGDLLMAIAFSLYRSRDRGETWEELELRREVRALVTVPSSGVILATTHDGLFRSLDSGATWIEPSIGPPPGSVEAFAAGADGALYAGGAVEEGEGAVFRSTDGGDRWHRVAPDSDISPVNAIAVLPDGDVVAGTRWGVIRWTPGDPEWQEFQLRTSPTRVASLVVDSGGRLIAGTSAAGVFVSEDRGQTWTPANLGLPARDVRIVAAGADGQLYVAAGGYLSEGNAIRERGPLGIYRGRFLSK